MISKRLKGCQTIVAASKRCQTIVMSQKGRQATAAMGSNKVLDNCNRIKMVNVLPLDITRLHTSTGRLCHSLICARNTYCFYNIC